MKPMTLVTAVALVLTSLGAFAQDPRHGARDKDDWIRGKLFGPEVILRHQSRIKLTDRQRDMIGAELKRVQAQAAESDWLMMSEASRLQELIDQHPVDGKAVLAGIERVFEAENRKKQLFIEMLINIKNALTPEQIAYLKSVSEES